MRSVKGAPAGQATGRRSGPHITIDLHAHVLVPDVESLVAECPEKRAEFALSVQAQGATSCEHNRRVMLPAAYSKLTSLDARLRDMDAMGVDFQVLSPAPNQYYYWADRDLAQKMVRLQNDHIASVQACAPGRLAALGNVALQHPDLALEQLDYCVQTLGFRGIEVSPAVQERELADPIFWPIWARAEALQCLVFIHPLGSSLGQRLNRHYLSNIIGQPIETTIALSHLIFGGVLDRYPGLRICAAHGGGYLPTYVGRSDHAWNTRPDSHSCDRQPSEYLRQIWFDSLVYTPAALRQLIDQVGVSQVVLGTDYPFDMGAFDPHQLVAAVPGLTDDERAAVLGLNASRLLSVPPSAFYRGTATD